MPNRIIPLLVFLCLIPIALIAQPELKFAELGNFKLDNGEIIQKCRLAYRTCGQLNADRSNAILFPTWFMGSTEDLLKYVGQGKFVDTTLYFLVLVEAFGNNISSSPSTSSLQPDSAFPSFSIRDLVRSQYFLLTKLLNVNQLHAIVGISMGGLQAFEWAVSYPKFAKKVVPIVGSPRLSSYDLLMWKAQYNLIEQCLRAGCEDTWLLVDMVTSLSRTPEQFNRRISREGVDSLVVKLRNREQPPRFTGRNVLRQTRALITHDVSLPFGGSLENAARRVESDLFIIVATHDRLVNPEPARTFAKLLGCNILELESDCAHWAYNCEMARVSEAVGQFLSDME